MVGESPHPGEYAGCTIPPAIHALAFNWDPRPEIDRLQLLARQAGAPVRHVLELGCGTGRLLRAWKAAGVEATGIELSAAMARFARQRVNGEPDPGHGTDAGSDRAQGTVAAVHAADMCRFDLGRTFDLIYTSANTIRHVCDGAQIATMWGCIRDHLAPGGLFIADLELGYEAEAAKVGRPARWHLSCEQGVVHASWEVIEAPAAHTRCCRVRWEFELRADAGCQTSREEFDLRTYDGPEFVALAEAAGLRLEGMYELRDPYLIPLQPERAAGRTLVVFRRPRPESHGGCGRPA